MAKAKAKRSIRIARLARLLAQRWERQDSNRGHPKKPLRRRERNPRVKRMIAYDLETSRIAAGTPKPKYITAFCDEWQCSARITSIKHLLEILQQRFLIPEFHNARFVAWNGNNFDVFFIAAALLHCDDYILRPYLTRSKSLRGLKVTTKAQYEYVDSRGRKKMRALSWEFLDGIAMTGLSGFTLKKFLEMFAPQYGKLIAPDWEHEEFDYRNAQHVAYAERDSEGLYRAMQAVEAITMQHFNLPLQPTIGNLGIKVFSAHIPDDVVVWQPGLEVMNLLRDQVMRGGYCHLQRKYHGPIWKYDINQAYAAAMRDAKLPTGRCFTMLEGASRYAKTSIQRITATRAGNIVPFYWRDDEGKSRFTNETIGPTWLTSIEVEQLVKEGWQVKCERSYFWEDSFSMKEYVDKLEQLRIHAPGGPSGAQGMVMKAIGNNSYGKTVEQSDGVEYILALEKPEGWHDVHGVDEGLQHCWFRFAKPVPKEYHQPQIGAFITAHVRMVVRRAALLDPLAWLYADTDCVVFTRPVNLPCDAKKYGFWKIEVAGEPYYHIAKKVYADISASVKHAKGLNIKRLNAEDFEAWYRGSPPEQTQVQRQNFVRVMTGAEMFAERTKLGEKIPLQKSA